MENQSSISNQIGIQPFNPFIILSSYDQGILFFTQTFARLSGFHPSTIPSSIPILALQALKPIIHNRGNFEIYQFKEKDSFYFRDSCVDALIHELRTVSLAIDLGTHVLTENDHMAPLLLQKLLRSKHRQRVSTLVASDFIQLVTSTLSFYPTSLTKVLTDGLSHSPTISKVRFRLASSVEAIILGHFDPNIWGNFHFLTRFFTTLLTWLEAESVTVEMEIINPISVQVSIKVPHDRFLSNIKGFSLISHYLHYFAAYFNGRGWVTQSAINVLFPIVFSDYYEQIPRQLSRVYLQK